MSNWCEVDLTITGNAAHPVQVVLDAIKGEDAGSTTDLDFNKLIPYPVEFRKMDDAAREYRVHLDALLQEKKKTCPCCQSECWPLARKCDKCGTELTVDPALQEKLDVLKSEYGVASDTPWPKDGFNSGGYEWCISNWGTKWNACEVMVEDGTERRRVMHFETAWAPPIPVMVALAQKFPEYRFKIRYYEGGVGFQGNVVFEHGEVVENMHGDYRGHRGG